MLVRSVGIGMVLGVGVLVIVWAAIPGVRAYLPHAAMVFPLGVAGMLVWLSLQFVAFGSCGAQVDLRAGRLFVYRIDGTTFRGQDIETVEVFVEGDVPVSVRVVGRAGPWPRLANRVTRCTVGVDPDIGVGEFVEVVEACLGVRAEVRQVEGGEVGGVGAGG